MRRIASLLLLAVLLLPTVLFAAAEVSPRLARALDQAEKDNSMVRALVFLDDQVDMATLDKFLYQTEATLEERSFTVITSLQDKARETQGRLAAKLQSKSSVEVKEWQSYWVVNMFVVEAAPEVLYELSRDAQVALMDIDAVLTYDKPVGFSRITGDKANSSETGLKAIKADLMWKAGYTGAGRLVMGMDTGVNGSHPALSYKWRGNTRPGSEAWIDPAYGTTTPNDGDASYSHGTHTMGTMCGLDPSTNDTIGVAFNAEWIASNSLMGGSPHTSRSIASFQWAMDPDNNPATVSDMPDAINNSWYDPSDSDCATSAYYQLFQNVEASGIAIVFSAGNSGPGSSTITTPKNININLVNVWATGAVDGNTAGFPITSFSSRGPSSCGGTGSLLIKPEASAPGNNVRSSQFSNQYGTLSGTSMAAPHVAGAIALLREAHPTITGYEAKMALYNTAVDLGDPGEDNVYGMGIIDVYAAHMSLADPDDPNPPEDFTVYSDYTTPNSIVLNWTDPATYVSNDPLVNFQLKISRDGSPVATVGSGVQTFTDNGVTDGTMYNYSIVAADIPNDSLSIEISEAWYAGGSPFPAAPSVLTAVGSETGAELSWLDPTTQADNTPLDDLAKIYIYRSGVLIDSVAPGVQSYSDSPAPGFVYQYSVRAVDSESPVNLSDPSDVIDCFVGSTPNYLVWVGPDAGGGAVTSGESIFQALLDNGESVFLSNDLYEFGNDLSVYRGIFVVLGIYSNNHVIGSSDPEGAALQSYIQGGGKLYLEGGDCFNYDPESGGFNIRPWFDLNDGNDGSGDVSGITGLNDFSMFSFSYSGDNNYMDELSPVNSIPIWKNSSNSDISGVYNPVYGSGRAIGVVPLFGGLTGTKTKLNSTLRTYEGVPRGPEAEIVKIRPESPDPALFGKKAGWYPERAIDRRPADELVRFSIKGVEILANTPTELMAAYVAILTSTYDPQIVVSDTAVSSELLVGESTQQTITITNQGSSLTDDLTYSIAENPDAAWLTVNPVSGTVTGGQSQDIVLTMDAASLVSGNYTTSLAITSNDTTTGTQYVSVSLDVVDAPSISVTPAILVDSLITGQTVAHSVMIHNGGPGVLEFTASAQMETKEEKAGWLSVSPESGSVAAGDSLELVLTMDATGLSGGLHYGELSVLSNDPVNPQSGTLVTLHVTGAAAYSVAPQSLDFGTMFTGYSDTLGFMLTSNGTDTLRITEMATTIPEFELLTAAPINLAPGAASEVSVAFHANSSAVFSDSVHITTNSGSGEHHVALTAVANEPPAISVTTDSLHFDLVSGAVDSLSFTIENQGNGPLVIYSIEDEDLSSVAKYNYVQPQKPAASFAKGSAEPVYGEQLAGRGGPDPFGYRWIDSDEADGPAYQFNDISATGNMVTLSQANSLYNVKDEGYAQINLPFPVKFYGELQDQITVTTNGLISFDGSFNGTTFSNQAIPVASAPNGVVAAFWDDLDGRAGGEIYTQQLGDQFVVQWHNWGHYPQGAENMIFQIVLVRESANIFLVYEHVVDESSSTFGIENMDGTAGLEIAYNQTYAHDGLLVKVSKDAEWLSARPSSATIPAGSSLDVSLTATSGQLTGDFLAELLILSNDPQNMLVRKPRVSMHIDGVPQMALDPSALDFGELWVGDSDTLAFNVVNSGTDSLHVFGASYYGVMFELLDEPAFVLAPGSSHPMHFAFQPMETGLFTDTLWFNADVANAPALALSGSAAHKARFGLDRTEVSESLLENSIDSTAVTIYNTGLGVLHVSMSPQDGSGGNADWFSIADSSLTVAAEDSQQLVIYLHPQTVDNYSGSIQFVTNDPDHPTASLTINLGVISGLDDGLAFGVPQQYELHQNYPNPFNPTTTIRYDLKQAGTVSLRVYNMMGQEVRSLVRQHQAAGYHTVDWDGTNNSGNMVSSGIYLYKLEAGPFMKTRKMIFMK